MRRKTKKTFFRRVILKPGAWKNSKRDFGLGPGVLVEQEVTYTDERGHGFNTERFAMEAIMEDDEVFRQFFAVVRVPKPKKKGRKR